MKQESEYLFMKTVVVIFLHGCRQWLLLFSDFLCNPCSQLPHAEMHHTMGTVFPCHAILQSSSKLIWGLMGKLYSWTCENCCCWENCCTQMHRTVAVKPTNLVFGSQVCKGNNKFYYMADIVRELWLVSLLVHNLRYGLQMLPTSPFARL